MTLAVVTAGESGIGAICAIRLQRAPQGMVVNRVAQAGILIESGLPLTTIAQDA